MVTEQRLGGGDREPRPCGADVVAEAFEARHGVGGGREDLCRHARPGVDLRRAS